MELSLDLGFLSQQGDLVSRSVLVLLASMSVVCWSIIPRKGLHLSRLQDWGSFIWGSEPVSVKDMAHRFVLLS